MGARKHPDTVKALQRVMDGKMTVLEAARAYGLHPTTLWKAKQRLVGKSLTSEVAKPLPDIA